MKIALIGMPTSGKSTISNLLHEKLQMSIIDIDSLLEKRFNTPLQEFIDLHGEQKFLEEENDLLLQIDYPEKCIISTGGSVVYAKEAMTHLKTIGVKFIYLHASLKILEERLSHQRKMRGIIMNGCTSWHELLMDRDMLYRYYADYIIETDTKDLHEIVKEIFPDN